MTFNPVAQLSRAYQSPQNRLGTISSLSGATATVSLGGGSILAYLSDQVLSEAAVGVVVIIAPVGSTWAVVSTLTGGGGTAPILGPELVPNGGFEFASGSVPDHWGWWPWVHGTYAINQDTTGGYVGTASLSVALIAGTPAADHQRLQRGGAGRRRQDLPGRPRRSRPPRRWRRW